jgi:hypothetical protein
MTHLSSRRSGENAAPGDVTASFKQNNTAHSCYLSVCVAVAVALRKLKYVICLQTKFFFLRNLQSTSALLSSFFVFVFISQPMNKHETCHGAERNPKEKFNPLARVSVNYSKCLRRPVYWRGQYSKTVKRKRNEEKNT